MAPWKVIVQHGKTYLATRETYYEILALRPVSEDSEDLESRQTVSCLETHATHDRETGLTLFPYVDVTTGRTIVPGDEHRYGSTENITKAIACIVAEQPWKQHIPFGERAFDDNDSSDDEEQGIAQHVVDGGETGDHTMSVEELRKAKRSARQQIAQARSAFNRRTKGDATANFKTWDDIRNARDNGDDDADTDDDDDNVSWGEIAKDVDSFVASASSSRKQRKKAATSSSKKSKQRVAFDGDSLSSDSEESRFDSDGSDNSGSIGSGTSSNGGDSSDESSAFDNAAQFAAASGGFKRGNGFDGDDSHNPIASSDTFDGTDDGNFSQKRQTSRKSDRRSSAARKRRHKNPLRRAAKGPEEQMQSDVEQQLQQQWSAKKEQAILAQQGEQWQSQGDVEQEQLQQSNSRDTAVGTHIPVPEDMYAAPEVIHEGNGVRVLRHRDGRIEKVRMAPAANSHSQQPSHQTTQKASGNDFKSGYGRAGPMPSGIPVINIDMTQVDDDADDSNDDSSDFGSDDEHLTMYDYDSQTGYLSARPSPGQEQQQQQQQQQQVDPSSQRVGGATITQATGELKDMQEYRERLSTVRNGDRQSQVAMNFLEATTADDADLPIEEGNFDGYAQNDNELKSHPARMALAEEYNPDKAGTDVVLPPEEECDVLLPINIEVDPDTGRVVRRLDDSLMGLTPKEAARAMKRRRRRAAAGLDAIDASRRTINSVTSGEAYRETLERQKREDQQREIEKQHLGDGPVQCDEYELEFIENYLAGEGRGCSSDAVWNAIVKYVRENSTLHEDKSTGERSISRPAMLPLEEFEQIARGKLSPFTASNVNAWSTKPATAGVNSAADKGEKNAQQQQPQQQKRKSQIPTNETPEQATARLAKEMRAFGMPPDMFNAAVQTAKYKDQQGEDEFGEFPQSVDEIMHMAKPFKSKRASAPASQSNNNATVNEVDGDKPTKKDHEKKQEVKQNPKEEVKQDPKREVKQSPKEEVKQEQKETKHQSNSNSAVVPYTETNVAVVKRAPLSVGTNLGIHDLVSIQSIMNRQLAAVSTQLGEMATLNQKIDQLLLSHLENSQQ